MLCIYLDTFVKSKSLSTKCIINYNLDDVSLIVQCARWGKDHFSVLHKNCMNNVILALSQWFTFTFISLNTSESPRCILLCYES